jgi:hypothetical protein
LEVFFRRHPNDLVRSTAYTALERLLACRVPLAGKPGGWAGGIVCAVGSRGCGVPNVFNRELEEAVGTTMSTIHKRAAQIRRLLDL